MNIPKDCSDCVWPGLSLNSAQLVICIMQMVLYAGIQMKGRMVLVVTLHLVIITAAANSVAQLKTVGFQRYLVIICVKCLDVMEEDSESEEGLASTSSIKVIELIISHIHQIRVFSKRYNVTFSCNKGLFI